MIDIKNKKWLILTYYTDIDKTSLVGGLRPYKLRDHLQKKGIDVEIVTRQKSRGDEIVIPESKIPALFKDLLRIIPPDRFIFWGTKVAFRLHKYSNYVFLSTSPPNGIHMAGLISKLLNKNIFWIIDYRDPFVLNDFYKPVFIKAFFDKWYEKTIFKNADVIILNTESNAESHKELYPFASKKMLTVRNGFDEIYMNTASEGNTFIYAGGTSKGLASKRIVELLNEINKLDINISCDFYGEHDGVVDDCIYTHYKGVLVPDEIPSLLRNYKFGFIYLPLPFIGGGRIAQKYYDYVGSGLIPVVINPSKEMENLVAKYNTGVCIFPDSKLSDIVRQISSASCNMSKEDQSSFTRGNQFEKLLSHLNL